MEKEFLSKNKKIYILSKDGNGFYVAKYPVVYLNQGFTYFKKGGEGMALEHVLTENVSDVLDEKGAERVIKSYCDRYIMTFIGGYWSVTDGALRVLKDGKKAIEVEQIKKRIAEARRDISLKQAEIRDLFDKISRLEFDLKWTDK